MSTSIVVYVVHVHHSNNTQNILLNCSVCLKQIHIFTTDSSLKSGIFLVITRGIKFNFFPSGF